MADRTRHINYFYPKAESTGYSPELTEKRFSVLRQLDFKSILDVGSGMCNLHGWLKRNGYDVKYDAVDIREDALALCDCETFTEFPPRKYDLVCLFGTVTFNIDEDKEANRQLLKDLLARAREASERFVLFTVMKTESLQGLARLQMVSFTRKEVEDLASSQGLVTILENIDPNEYIVIVSKP